MMAEWIVMFVWTVPLRHNPTRFII